jgi:predicted RNase H-like HicB family nuclease
VDSDSALGRGCGQKENVLSGKNAMSLLPCNEIRTEYDDDSQSYYIIWQPLTAIGMGRTEQEALEDLRAAAHFGIETMVNSKLRIISSDPFAKG